MPDLDGYQTVALIRQRQRSRDIPVIFLTAVYDQPAHMYRAYALGAVDYIAKPFDAEVLRGKVRALVLLYTRGERAERERAQQAERMKDLFLGAVSHDPRNPLNAIVLGAQMTLRKADCARPEHAAHAMRIERAAKRMRRIIEDIPDLTRGQFAGGISVSPVAPRIFRRCAAASSTSAGSLTPSAEVRRGASQAGPRTASGIRIGSDVSCRTSSATPWNTAKETGSVARPRDGPG